MITDVEIKRLREALKTTELMHLSGPEVCTYSSQLVVDYVPTLLDEIERLRAALEWYATCGERGYSAENLGRRAREALGK